MVDITYSPMAKALRDLYRLQRQQIPMDLHDFHSINSTVLFGRGEPP